MAGSDSLFLLISQSSEYMKGSTVETENYLKQLSAEIHKVIPDIGSLGKAVKKKKKSKGGGGGGAKKQAASALKELGNEIGRIIPGFRQLSAISTDISKNLAGASQAGADSGAALAGVAIGAVAVVAGFVALAGVTKSFVEALSPQTIREFNRAMRDLYATIGVAFLPMFQVLTGAIRQMGATLLPVMQALAPVVSSLTQVFLGVLMPVIRVLAGLLLALMPVIVLALLPLQLLAEAIKPNLAVLEGFAEILGDVGQLVLAFLSPLFEVFNVFQAVMDGISDTIRIVTIIFRTAIQSVTAFVQSFMALFSLSSVVKDIKDAFHQAIKAILLTVATLAKLFGATDFLKRLIQNLKPQQGALATPENVSIKGFEQIGKDLAVSSFQSAPGAAPVVKDDIRDIIAEMERIEKGQSKGLQDVIIAVESVKTTIDDWVKWLKEHTPDGQTVKTAGFAARPGVLAAGARALFGF